MNSDLGWRDASSSIWFESRAISTFEGLFLNSLLMFLKNFPIFLPSLQAIFWVGKYYNKAEFMVFRWEGKKLLSLVTNFLEFRRSGEMQWHRSGAKLSGEFGWLDLVESGV